MKMELLNLAFKIKIFFILTILSLLWVYFKKSNIKKNYLVVAFLNIFLNYSQSCSLSPFIKEKNKNGLFTTLYPSPNIMRGTI